MWSLWIYSTGVLLNCLDVWINVLHQIWEIFSHYIIKYFLMPTLASLGGSHYAYVVTLIMSCRSLRMFIFIHFFICVSQTGQTINSIFKVIDSLSYQFKSVIEHPLLIFFFISLITLFHSKISVSFLDLNNFYLCIDIKYLMSHTCHTTFL